MEKKLMFPFLSWEEKDKILFLKCKSIKEKEQKVMLSI